MGFTTEGARKYRDQGFLGDNQNRAWNVWDEPPSDLPQAVTAFKLVFPTSELVLTPEQRTTSLWNNVVYVDIWKELPTDWMTIVTLFVTTGNRQPQHETGRSFWLALLDIGGGRYAQLVAHGDPQGDIDEVIEDALAIPLEAARRGAREIPPAAYAYILGIRLEGVRYLVGGRLNR
jgi:hypothetical protein